MGRSGVVKPRSRMSKKKRGGGGKDTRLKKLAL